MAKAWHRKDTNTWYVLYGLRGKVRVGKDRKAAEYLANKLNIEEAEKRAGLIKPAQTPSITAMPVSKEASEASDEPKRITGIKDFFNYYLEFYCQNNRSSTRKRYSGIMRNFFTFLELKYPGIKKLNQLKPFIFEEFKAFRKTTPINKNGSPVSAVQINKKNKDKNFQEGARTKTINCEIMSLKTFLKQAKINKFIDENPVETVKYFEVNDSKEKRPLTKEELQKFLKHLLGTNKELYDKFIILAFTGMRSGELQHLTWDNINLDEGIIHIRLVKFINPQTGKTETWHPKSKKNSGKREIPIHPKVQEVLKERLKTQKIGENFVFLPYMDTGYFEKTLRRHMLSIMKKLGIQNFTRVHDFRTTFISLMAMEGVPKDTIKDIVGHVDDETYEIYRHTTKDHRLQSIKKLKIQL